MPFISIAYFLFTSRVLRRVPAARVVLAIGLGLTDTVIPSSATFFPRLTVTLRVFCEGLGLPLISAKP
jgi:hypothetical protein